MGAFRVAIVAAFAAFWLASATTARAEDEQVSRRLTQHGKLSKGEAKKLANAVTKEMGKSAGMTNRDDDPLRMAVSKALSAPLSADR